MKIHMEMRQRGDTVSDVSGVLPSLIGRLNC